MSSVQPTATVILPVPSIADAGNAHITETTLVSIPVPSATNSHQSPPRSPRAPHRPVSAINPTDERSATIATLVLKDGSSYEGISFGAEAKSVSGECVFQTGESCSS